MTTPQPSMAERLLDLDPKTPINRRDFEQQVKELFVKPLTPADWVRVAVMGLGGLVGAVVCGLLAATEPASTPTLTRAVLAVLACVGLFWAVLAAGMARRGAASPFHRAAAAKMGFLFSLAAAALIGVASLAGVGASPTAGLVILLMATLVLASIVIVGHEIRQAELRLQQRLLEIEYRLARLTEATLLEQMHDRE